MQTGRSRVGYPVEEGNSEVSALTGYPAMTGKSKVRSLCGRGNPTVGGPWVPWCPGLDG
jgi:hypothetical protein